MRHLIFSTRNQFIALSSFHDNQPFRSLCVKYESEIKSLLHKWDAGDDQSVLFYLDKSRTVVMKGSGAAKLDDGERGRKHNRQSRTDKQSKAELTKQNGIEKSTDDEDSKGCKAEEKKRKKKEKEKKEDLFIFS